MPNYVLLLHNDPSAFEGIAPKDMQGVVEKYMRWSDQLERDGRRRAGEKLTDEPGRHLVRQNGSLSVVDGPYGETKEVVGGFFIIEASDYDEAVQISQGCPHLDYGGRIEVRQIDSHAPAEENGRA